MPSAPTPDRQTDAQRIAHVLEKYWGYSSLRPLQHEAIAAALAKPTPRDAVVVLPTGGGKSLCFQVPPLVTGTLTVVISPLIALIKDQVDGLKLAGVPAAGLYSGVDSSEASTARAGIADGSLRLLYVAPERLLGGSDLISQLARAHDRGTLGGIAIDEAHCISQWGHDFRPEYRRLSELRDVLPGAPMWAYTATATPTVRQDIAEQLRLIDPVVLVGTFDRPNLTYRVVPREGSGDEQVREALEPHRGRAAIVYCLSRADTESMASELSARGLEARAYHAGLSHTTRHKVQDDFLSERLNIVCATVAFGMGIDRGDVRCVVHASMPKSIEAYQQETGRAGRDGLPSECVLLYSGADAVRWSQLIERSARQSTEDVSPEVIAQQLAHIEQMRSFAAGARCRHRALSEYFGQTYDKPSCGACDVCLGELEELPEAQVVAQKVVSCVARLKEPFGAAYIADVLRGSGQGKIIQRGHHTLSTFGLLRQMDRGSLLSVITQLVDAGVLQREGSEFPVLRLTATSAALLKGQTTVRLVQQRAKAPSTSGSSSSASPGSLVGTRRAQGGSRGAASRQTLEGPELEVFEDLRVLRRSIAQEMNVPPYVVFGDAVLEQLARVRPTTLEAFARIKGVGAAKLSQFGERFVESIAAAAASRGLSTNIGMPAHVVRPPMD